MAKENLIQSSTRFFKEVRVEMKKVVWPTKKQLINNTSVVIVCILTIGIAIWLLDAGFSVLFKEVLPAPAVEYSDDFGQDMPIGEDGAPIDLESMIESGEIDPSVLEGLDLSALEDSEDGTVEGAVEEDAPVVVDDGEATGETPDSETP